MFQSEVQARIEQKVHAKYVRYVARHRQRTWCFSDSWRNFARSWRRKRNWVFRQLIFSRTFALTVLLMAFAGMVVAWVFVPTVIVSGLYFLWSAILLERPIRLDDLSDQQIAEIAFTRLTVLHSLAWMGITVAGISFAATESDRPKREFLSRALLTRTHRTALLAGAILLAFAVLIGGGTASLPLPHFWPSLSALALVCVVWGWANIGIGDWLGQFHCPNPKGVVAAMLFLGLAVAGLGIMIPLSGRSAIQISTHLAWLGPLGWLYHQVIKIGIGGWSHSGPLLLALGIVLLMAEAARRQVLTWGHRRRVLSHVLHSSGESAKPASPKGQRSLSPREIIRDELRRVPSRWLGWIWPTWLAEQLRFYVVVVIGGVLSQGAGLALHLWLIRLADGGTGGQIDSPSTDIELSLVALGVVIGCIELIGLVYRDATDHLQVNKRPLSPWGLWKQSQWQGLVRLPTVVLHAAPFLAVPLLIAEEGSWYVPLLTVPLCLATLIVLRTLLLAFAVATHSGVTLLLRLPPGIGESVSTLLAFPLAIALFPLALMSSMPLEHGSLDTILAQVFLQAISLILLALATGLWHRTGRLPRMPNDC